MLWEEKKKGRKGRVVSLRIEKLPDEPLFAQFVCDIGRRGILRRARGKYGNKTKPNKVDFKSENRQELKRYGHAYFRCKIRFCTSFK